jgi:hypothetical protein
VLMGLQTAVLSLGALFAVLGSIVLRAPLLGFICVGLAVLSGWLTTAWRHERPWCWWVLMTVYGLGLLMSLGDLLTDGPSWPTLISLAVDSVLLVLLLHPDSRARIDPPAAVAPPSRSWSVS